MKGRRDMGTKGRREATERRSDGATERLTDRVFSPFHFFTLSPCRRRLRCALTLVELLAVIVLVGLVAGGLTLNWRGATDAVRLRAATRQLEQNLRLARHRATTRHEPVWLQLRCGTGAYRIAGRDEAKGPGPVWQVLEGVTVEQAAVIQTGEQPPVQEVFVLRLTPGGATLPWAVELRAGPARRVVWTDGVTGRLRQRAGATWNDRPWRRELEETAR